MSITDGHQLLVQHLIDMPGSTDIALPNGPGKELPRYVVEIAGGAQRTATHGGETDASPEIVVRVETRNEYTTENDALVKALVNRFTPGTRIGTLTILDAPLPRPPLPGPTYSVPVIIRGSYSFT